MGSVMEISGCSKVCNVRFENVWVSNNLFTEMSSEGVSPRTPASGRISPRSGSSGGSSDQLTPSLPAPKKKRNRIYTLEDEFDPEEENARYSESASASSFIFLSLIYLEVRHGAKRMSLLWII